MIVTLKEGLKWNVCYQRKGGDCLIVLIGHREPPNPGRRLQTIFF